MITPAPVTRYQDKKRGGVIQPQTKMQAKDRTFFEKLRKMSKFNVLACTLVIFNPPSKYVIGSVPKDTPVLFLQTKKGDVTA